MIYTKLGRTNLEVSAVSFGGIPIQRSDENNTVEVVDELERQGINYIDTARAYTVSEGYLGNALKGRRDKFILATKSMARDYESMRKDIQISLSELQTDYIDIYQIHNLPLSDFEQVFGKEGAYKALVEAKEAGTIGYIGATAHIVEVLEKLVIEYGDVVDTIMFPFNIVENQGEEMLILAKEKNIGTIAMKPLAGGNLQDVDLAFKYILSNGCIDIIIPGMGDVKEVIEDVAVCKIELTLTDADKQKCEEIKEQLGTTFCRRCGYCVPCPKDINIPTTLLFENYLRNYEGLQDWARERYASLPVKADACIKCGLCEKKCPYELPIRDLLERTAKGFE